VAKTIHRPVTYEDLLKIPEYLVAEIIEGELHTSPRPRSRHGKTAGRLYSFLERGFEIGDGGPGGWWVLPEPEIVFGSDRLVPDLAGWRREKVPEFLDVTAWTIIPDWICEVLSPSTAQIDRMRKLPIYARYGVEYAWIVDPVTRTIEAFHLERGHWVLLGTYGGDDTARIEPFDAVEIPLATLWLPESPAA
jgi:Uma2 family endonuclease